MHQPRYIELLKSGELEGRAKKLKDMLKNCVLCPHQCKVNRLKGERGYCKTLNNPIVSGAEAHFGEEPELVGSYGSGTIFFSHCNLACRFCQNYEISFCGVGSEIDTYQLSRVMLQLQKHRCHNINLVSPGHIIPQIVEAIYLAAIDGLNIPIVYNTNGYDLTDTLKLLNGIIDIYMPDIKFSDDTIAEKYLGVRQYFTIAKAAVKEMFHQVGNLKVDNKNLAYGGLMIRHLVMPENITGTDTIMVYVAEEISTDTYVNIMEQYQPYHEAYKYREINRKITDLEFSKAIDFAKEAGLKNIHY